MSYFEDDLVDDWVDLCFEHFEGAFLYSGGRFGGRWGVRAEHAVIYIFIIDALSGQASLPHVRNSDRGTAVPPLPF
jgi:hypothetical protein